MLLAMYEGFDASGVNEGLNPDLYWKWKKGLHKPYTGRWFFFLTKYSFPNTVLKNFGILQICRTVPYRNKIPENAGACWGHLKEYILMFISINLGLWYLKLISTSFRNWKLSLPLILSLFQPIYRWLVLFAIDIWIVRLLSIDTYDQSNGLTWSTEYIRCSVG